MKIIILPLYMDLNDMLFVKYLDSHDMLKTDYDYAATTLLNIIKTPKLFGELLTDRLHVVSFHNLNDFNDSYMTNDNDVLYIHLMTEVLCMVKNIKELVKVHEINLDEYNFAQREHYAIKLFTVNNLLDGDYLQ